VFSQHCRATCLGGHAGHGGGAKRALHAVYAEPEPRIERVPDGLFEGEEAVLHLHDCVTSRHLACATTQMKEAMGMPKVSRDSAPQRQDAGPVVDLRDELDGYTVSFTSLLEDIDATPFMKGLPDDRCQCPHWGYVFKGKMTARYADRDEVFEVGDAFYTPPGHVPVKNEPGTEILWFSPSEELRTAEAVMMKNMQAMQDGSTP
jgi:hypothetical protein